MIPGHVSTRSIMTPIVAIGSMRVALIQIIATISISNRQSTCIEIRTLQTFYWPFGSRNSAEVEGAIMLTISILIVPANVLAIYRFWRQKLNKLFLTLAISLCVNNFLMAALGIMFGIAKFADNHPLGHIGCVFTLMPLGGIAMFTMYVQVLISYERRRVVLCDSFFKIKTRMYVLLGLAGAYSFIYWTICMTVLGAADLFTARIDKNSTETITICNPADIFFLGSNEVLFSIQAFIIPVGLIIFNYW